MAQSTCCCTWYHNSSFSRRTRLNTVMLQCHVVEVSKLIWRSLPKNVLCQVSVHTSHAVHTLHQRHIDVVANVVVTLRPTLCYVRMATFSFVVSIRWKLIAIHVKSLAWWWCVFNADLLQFMWYLVAERGYSLFELPARPDHKPSQQVHCIEIRSCQAPAGSYTHPVPRSKWA